MAAGTYGGENTKYEKHLLRFFCPATAAFEISNKYCLVLSVIYNVEGWVAAGNRCVLHVNRLYILVRGTLEPQAHYDIILNMNYGQCNHDL